MRKQAAPVDRVARISSPIEDPARTRRIDIAYRAYVLKALRRFDQDGKAASSRPHRTPMPSTSAVNSES
jgi:hypothetical protein